MAVIIKTENLSKTYSGKIKAIDSINIEIDEGEVYGLLGPNGAGKSTTINLLTTRITPTTGTALVNGFDIRKHSMDVRKSIGVVPQDLTTDEDLTGYENLMMVSRFYDVPKDTANERIAKLLNLVDLEEAAGRYVKQYSGGMRKRLELIVGLVHDPKILFLDEPTLGLDVQTRTQMWEYVRDIQKKLNVTIILTSHYLEEVDALANRISIIDHGKILITGTPEDLKSSLKGDIVQMTFKSQEDADVMKQFPQATETKDFGPNIVRVTVKNSDEVLPSLINYVSEKKLTIIRMTVQKPSLDEVFLQYTGRDIRQEDAGDVRKMMMNMRRMRR
ncbi:MAG: ATP-binding cassette domain-containing protein [Candidatus Thermoplasmatota archaeon]|jgi:ABC-2 type transport system ATP-binding protein|nr:ATP-binding cassette domain-containing protein [Candidatus Thermoplasmatota archaeon]MCL5955808.1 ATP-binding cassette domain-containing protein [Candidatus Thermoplasmatota archaeon]